MYVIFRLFFVQFDSQHSLLITPLFPSGFVLLVVIAFLCLHREFAPTGVASTIRVVQRLFGRVLELYFHRERKVILGTAHTATWHSHTQYVFTLCSLLSLDTVSSCRFVFPQRSHHIQPPCR